MTIIRGMIAFTRRHRIAAWAMALALTTASCARDAAAPDGWQRTAVQPVRIGTRVAGAIAREALVSGACVDSVRDVFAAEGPRPDSLWLDWREVPDRLADPFAPALDGVMLRPDARGRAVVRQRPVADCRDTPSGTATTWAVGSVWQGGGVEVLDGFAFHAGPVALRDTVTFRRCAGTARFRSGDGLAILSLGGCTFRAAPPLITGLLTLDPEAPGGAIAQDQLRLVSLGRVAGGANPRDTLVVRVELTRTEGPARGRRDTALLVLGRVAP